MFLDRLGEEAEPHAVADEVVNLQKHQCRVELRGFRFGDGTGGAQDRAFGEWSVLDVHRLRELRSHPLARIGERHLADVDVEVGSRQKSLPHVAALFDEHGAHRFGILENREDRRPESFDVGSCVHLHVEPGDVEGRVAGCLHRQIDVALAGEDRQCDIVRVAVCADRSVCVCRGVAVGACRGH